MKGCAVVVAKILGGVTLAIGGWLAIGLLANLLGRKVSEEDVRRSQFCQDEAVRERIGVIQDPKTRMYKYSEDKIERLAYHSFMVDCLPDSYYPKKYEVEKLEKLKQNLGTM